MAQFGKRSPLLLFFILAYGISWILCLPLVISQRGLGWIQADVLFEFIVPGAFAPTIAALLVQRLKEGNFRIARLVSSPRRFMVGIGAGLGIVALGYIAVPALAMTTASPAALHWNAFLSWSTYHVNHSTFLGGPVNEEPGWRGFALPQLQARFGPWRPSLLLGVLWAGWHLPLFLVRGWAGLPVWAYVLLVSGFSVVMTFGANRSGFNIIVYVLMHALFNTSSRLLGGLLTDNSLRTNSTLVYVVSSLVVPLALIVATRGKIGARHGCH